MSDPENSNSEEDVSTDPEMAGGRRQLPSKWVMFGILLTLALVLYGSIIYKIDKFGP